MNKNLVYRGFVLALAGMCLAVAGPEIHAATDAKVPVQSFELDNGMTFLLVPQPEKSTVAAGWVAKVGSANERPGITGLSHLFEHMMFKGTHTIGTTNVDRDLEIIAEQEEIQKRIREIYRDQRARWRRGEIDDPFDPENRTEEQIELEKKFEALVEEQRELMIKDEFDKIYTEAGGSSMNAGTMEDLTLYFINVPANKLELWFWMESDRLGTPVFREFYSERDVVHEERRLRTESTPTGKFDEQFEAMFWESHPYSWPVLGWPSDLRTVSKEQADEYFDTYYAPNNLTAAMVGNFDVDEVKALAKKYFGRLPRGDREPPDVVTLEMDQLAEKRMVAECDCQPQIEVRYHTVPFMHTDSYALDVLEGLMNGRTGRLYKSMVLGEEIAASASAGQRSAKYAGYFSFGGETKGDATPEQLEAGWYADLQKIIDEPIPAEELQKVKNRIAADAYRRLQSQFFLMFQLLWYEGYGDWKYINSWSDATLAVTEEDVKRVAAGYFKPENRAVAVYNRKAGSQTEEWPPELAALPGQQQEMIKTQLRQLRQVEDPAMLEQILGRIQQQKGQMPEEMQKGIGLIERWIENRIKELGEAGDAAAPAEGGAS
jgi:predicted Zn-dependent peptidase